MGTFLTALLFFVSWIPAFAGMAPSLCCHPSKQAGKRLPEAVGKLCVSQISAQRNKACRWDPGNDSPLLLASLDPRLAERTWEAYVPHLHQQFVRELELDWNTRSSLQETQATKLSIRLFLDSHGEITHATLEHPSSNAEFNRACLRAARRLPALELAPAALKQGQREGLVFHFGTK